MRQISNSESSSNTIFSDKLFSAEGPYGQLGPVNLPYERHNVAEEPLKAWSFNAEGRSSALNLETENLHYDISDVTKIVFDVDGLLVNSEPVILFVILETAKNFIKPDQMAKYYSLIEDIKKQCFGNSEDKMCSELFKFLNSRGMLISEVAKLNQEEFFTKFTGDRVETYLKFCDLGFVQPMHGAVEFVLQAYEKMGELAINTGSPINLSEKMLQSTFSKSFEVDQVFPRRLRTFVSDLPVGFGKPNPDGYLRAAKLLDVAPWELAAVVDRGNDLLSALRATYKKVLVVPENHDLEPFQQETGKHSLREYLLKNNNMSERQEIANKVLAVGSLGWVKLEN